MKKFYSIAAILIFVCIIFYVSVVFVVDKGTYLLKQDDITKIETIKGMHLKVVRVEDMDICNNIKIVAIEGHYYFGGNLWTNVSEELEHSGIVYYGYK